MYRGNKWGSSKSVFGKWKQSECTKSDLPLPWPGPCTPQQTAFRGLVGAEPRGTSIPQGSEEWSRLLHWGECDPGQQPLHLWSTWRDLQRPQTFPWENTQLPPRLCRPGPCPQSGPCNSKMHVMEKARQRWPSPQQSSLVTLSLHQLSSKLCETHFLSSSLHFLLMFG